MKNTLEMTYLELNNELIILRARSIEITKRMNIMESNLGSSTGNCQSGNYKQAIKEK